MKHKIVNGISVIIPSYNAASWLPNTCRRIDTALQKALKKYDIKLEIIIVDDGSTDETRAVAKKLKNTSKIPIEYVYQKNKGRYVTRKNGLLKAKYDYVWFIDTRVYTDINAIEYVLSEIQTESKDMVWNAHVYVDKKGNMIARFMDAITFIGWRKYFKNPRRCSYGVEDFDYYPKGTTSFIAPKSIIQESIKEFDKEKRDLKTSSDDTHLIRYIAGKYPINLSPDFSCVYHARSTLRGFVKHTYHRGQVFVDGFFRPNTRFFIPIIIFLILSIIIAISLLIRLEFGLYYISLVFVGLLVEFFVAIALGLAFKDALSLVILTPVFALFYGMGIWIGIVKKYIK